MRTRRLAVLLALASVAGCGRSTDAAVPSRAGPVRSLVAAKPFAVAAPYAHRWRREQPEVRAGWLLVLEVDPLYVEPHQTAMPVLLLGDQTVECVNFGLESGRVIAIVPAAADPAGMPALDLVANPAWFGPPELPERVDAGWIAAARAKARPEEIASFTASEVAQARKRGGALLQAADRVEIDRLAARWILEHAPAERELAEGLLVPVTK